MTYSWNWPIPLEPGQQFTVYVIDESGQETALGTLNTPAHGTLYRFQGSFLDTLETTGLFDWVVRLESGNVNLWESESRQFVCAVEP